MGFFDGIAKALGDAANTVVGVAGDVYHAAASNVFVQGVAAVYTGGLSLVGQAAAAGISGQANELTGTVHDIFTDPGKVAKAIPGALLESGVTGITADAVKIGAGVLGNVYAKNGAGGGPASNSTIGADPSAQVPASNPFADVYGGVGAGENILKGDPILSTKIIGGIVMVGTGAGVPAGAALLSSSAAELYAKAAGVVSADNIIKQGGAAQGSPPPDDKKDEKPANDAGTTHQATAPTGKVNPARTGFVNKVVSYVETALNVDIPGFGKGK